MEKESEPGRLREIIGDLFKIDPKSINMKSQLKKDFILTDECTNLWAVEQLPGDDINLVFIAGDAYHGKFGIYAKAVAEVAEPLCRRGFRYDNVARTVEQEGEPLGDYLVKNFFIPKAERKKGEEKKEWRRKFQYILVGKIDSVTSLEERWTLYVAPTFVPEERKMKSLKEANTKTNEKNTEVEEAQTGSSKKKTS